jgi:hypothetical protein
MYSAWLLISGCGVDGPQTTRVDCASPAELPASVTCRGGI